MKAAVSRKLRVSDDTAGLIRGLHPLLKARLKASLHMIVSDPFVGKALKEELSGLRSYRVQRFRVVYRVAEDGAVDVVAVGPRQTIYEETLRILRRERR